ncbi:bidirectional sugar transporter SWEET3 [Rosa rugosa]|uniref:Bidirectional sugar transporter SWEET n=1 Tax=Rosa chinensis TaxID=74649 RepID=A0A2P6SNS4_ROSCH|nr:bidirectional sugar transporter SWEET3 [Rosa chinensis]XP_062001375.1 bidirectional sugar transporter SWEET3 [Rosa rugosa]PRQ60345.1 putative SWEET sugar transporter [Rosa chinensis]
MGERLRLATGVMGNAASLLLYSTPILTMSRITRKKSTEEFSCVPYITALLNCLLYTWYGLPVVSCGWENFPVVTINGLGILLEFSFILIYFWFASPTRKMKVIAILIPVMVMFCITVSISTFVFHDHRHRKEFVGSLGLVASVTMYASPLVAVKQVIVTKSVEFMPFYLSFFSFLSSSLWMAYGLLGHDLFLASPNLVGSPLGIFQLLLYCKYRKREMKTVESPNNWDVEENDEKSKQLQIVISESANGKS